MANFEFILPLGKEELTRSESVGQYFVKDVLSPREIGDGTREYLSKKKFLDVNIAIDSFDLLYSAIVKFHSLEEKVIQGALEIALISVSKVESELTLLLDDSNQPLSSTAKKCAQNQLKMSCYALCHLTQLIEGEVCKPSADIPLVATKGRKKVATKNVKFLDWGYDKAKVLLSLQHLCELPLQRLWSPHPVEEEFINLVANCCFKLIEDPNSAKTSAVKDAVVTILGLSIKKHSYAIACVMKIMQLLQAREHAAGFFADAMLVFVEKFGMTNMVGDTIRELCRLDSLESAQDSGSIRNIAVFLVELSERVPELVLKSASLLLSLLDVKSYTIRNSALTVFCKIVLVVLSRDDLDSKEKELRDSLLDSLEEHLMDENAFVRGKCLQLWHELCSKGSIPLNRQRPLVEMVANRLWDKSSVVRKHAVAFLANNLENNPFSAKLSLERLQKNLEAEEEKLSRMLPQNEEDGVVEEEIGLADSSWMQMLPNIQEALQKRGCENVVGSSEDKEEEEEEEALLEDVHQEIRALLKKGCYTEAVAVVKRVMAAHPEANLFCSRDTSLDPPENCESKEKDGGSENGTPSLVDLLKKIYHGDKHASSKEKESLPEPPNSKPVRRTNDGTTMNELSKQKILVQYLKDCVMFAKQVREVIPVLCELLYSRTSSDVLEAVAFFVSAHRFGVEDASLGIRKMLPLVWSREASVRDAVVTSYRDIYFGQDSSAKRSKTSNIADNLSDLASTATANELICLEKLVTELVKSGDISPKILRAFWDRFSLQQPEITEAQSLAAAQLLSMAASADVGIVKKNLDVLINVGLGERAEANLNLCKHTCSILEKLANSGKSEKEVQGRLEDSHPIFVSLKNILLNTFMDLDTDAWNPTMEKAINVIYKLASHPDEIANNLLQQMAAKLLDPETKQTSAPVGDRDPQEPDKGATAAREGEKEEKSSEDFSQLPAVVLSRALACVGHVALRQLIYLDVDVFTEIKRQREVGKDERERSNKRKKRQSMSAIVCGSPSVMEQSGENPDDEMMGPACDDVDAEYIIHLLDNVVLHEDSALGTWSRLVVTVASEPSKYKSACVRTNASLSLAKLMLINAAFCEGHLKLLFTILEKSPEPVIRSNLVVAVGDLVVRFPNLLYSWTDKIYAQLQDSSREVRLTTLKVLSFLILNDLIKVKGQMSYLALLVTDKDLEVADMSKDFFMELGKKGNSLYNLLPDVISHLSNPEHGAEEDRFRTIMRVLFSCISKDRQLENFVEKLCLRFLTVDDERQWRDLAFCLSLVSYGERGIRKLHENLACYGDKLHLDSVYESFSSIISGAKKTPVMKVELKTLLQELEDIIEELRNKGVTEEGLLQKTCKSAAQRQNAGRGVRTSCSVPRGRKPPSQSARKGPKTRRRAKFEDSSEESDYEIEKTALKTPQVSRQPVTRGVVKVKIQFSDSDISDDDDLQK